MQIKTLRGLIADRQLTVTSLLEQMSLTRATIYRKFKDPDTFTVSEIREMALALDCDECYIIELINTRPESTE